MRGRVLIAWAGALWIAAGIEAGLGLATPGPIFLVAVSAGLFSGTAVGLCAGALAGLCSAALHSGASLPVLGLLALASGAAAGGVGRWLSRRHLLVAIAVAVASSLLASLILAVLNGAHFHAALLVSLVRAGQNALWMACIYGIVIVVFQRRTSRYLPGTAGYE